MVNKNSKNREILLGVCYLNNKKPKAVFQYLLYLRGVQQ